MKHDALLTDDADLVQRLEEKTLNFMSPLNTKDGFDQDKYEELLAVLEECQTAWEIEPYVPMAAASLFIEISTWPFKLCEYYEQPAKQEIFDAALVLEQRVCDIVNP